MKPSAPQPVKLIVGILYSDEVLLERAQEILQEKYGKIDFQSQKFEFTVTDYYCSEMGSPIYRLFISFQQLIHPKEIARIKTETNAIEEQLAVEGKRKVNVDPGYMDFDKVVLASAKYNGQKIYLDFGIWADLTLYYQKGNFYPYPWSFPDFKSGIYNRCFLRIRELYKTQSKNIRFSKKEK
ncbi:DUF4416 domain-containing protein [candidate division KSB1 bacterium]|nr:MAG: DUF4416 domain-containing protein [candidate division KSB1 bacterium]